MSLSTAYEIRPSPIHGLGLFALRDFQPNELILRDPIVLDIPKSHPGPNEPVHSNEIYAAFLTAPKNVQDAVRQLTPLTHPVAQSEITAHLYGFQSSFDMEYFVAFHVAAVFNNNAFGETRGQWIALDASRINHSCTESNARASRADGHEEIFATRAIKAGEEVLIPYVNSGLRGWRRRESLELWGIPACKCELCVLPEGIVGEGKEEWYWPYGKEAWEDPYGETNPED